MKARSTSRRRAPWVVAAVVLIPLAALAVVYFAFFGDDSPDELTLSDPPASDATVPAAEPGDLTGTWSVGQGSVAGYRVREKLARLPAQSDAVGRTESVSGSLVVRETGSGLVAEDVNVEVDVSNLSSDESRRDQRIRTQGLESEQFPTATFVSSSPVALPDGLAGGEAGSTEVTGDLTIHGVTRQVTIPLQVRLAGASGEVVGSYTFPFSEFDMEPPNIGGFVTVEPDATLEFRLTLTRA